jgi:hypothetical protein
MSLPSSEYSGSVGNWLNLSSSDNVSGSPGFLAHSSSSRSPVTTSSKKGGDRGSPAPSSTETKIPWYSDPNTSLSSTLVQKSKDNVFGRTFTHIFQPLTHFVDSVFKLIQSVGFAISSVGKDDEQKNELKAKSFYALKSAGNSLLRTVSSVFNLFTGYQKEIGLSKLAMNPYTASPVASSRDTVGSSRTSSRASSDIALGDLEDLRRVDTAESLSAILGNGGHDTELADELREILREDLPPSVSGSGSVEDLPPPTGGSSEYFSAGRSSSGEDVSRSTSGSLQSIPDDILELAGVLGGSRKTPSTQSAPSRVGSRIIGGDSLPSSTHPGSTDFESFDISGLRGLLEEMQPKTSTYKATNGVIGRATNVAMQALGHTPPPPSVTTSV